jgi:catechol 2,3-dioxygenase-like lactoylglutathione lyase family enzyme
MISHVSIGVADVDRARKFYDAVFGPLGYKRVFEGEGYMAYGANQAEFWVAQSAHPPGPQPDSGLHFCFDAPSRAAVDAFHAAALTAGGTDNGKPGLRPEYHAAYYAAFAIDPDGWRIEAYHDG